MFQKLILFLTLIVTLNSCKDNKEKRKEIVDENIDSTTNESSEEWDKLTFEQKIDSIKNYTSPDSVLSFDLEFINSKILKEKYKVDFTKYLKNECYPMRLNKSLLIKDFEGYQNIGDINNDKKDDFVFVLNPLNYCEEGQSYYFSAPEIPRIYTESNCCHPNSIFSIGDIDEDGRNEIAQYFSSCSSRFKHIKVRTYKNDEWKIIGEFDFALNDKYEEYEDFHKLYKKKSKGVFQFLEISDVNAEGEIVSEWKTINMD